MKTTINFRIENELKDDLQFIAEDRELKLSNLIREILKDYSKEYFYQQKENCVDEITLYIPYSNIDNT